MNVDLLPCPFCNGTAKRCKSLSTGGVGQNGYFVKCSSCNAEGSFGMTEAESIESWNNRPGYDKVVAELKDLKTWKSARMELPSIDKDVLFIPYDYGELYAGNYNVYGFRDTDNNCIFDDDEVKFWKYSPEKPDWNSAE